MHRFTEQVKLAPRRIHIDIYLLYMNIIKQNHFIHFKEQAFPKHSLQKKGHEPLRRRITTSLSCLFSIEYAAAPYPRTLPTRNGIG